MKIVFYFHGFGSSPNTDKVEKLKQNFEKVYAFPIDVDPDISLPLLDEKITQVLIENVGADETNVVFVGTSLGAWYAAYLAVNCGTKAVLINPTYSVEAIKAELDISPEIEAKYRTIGFVYPSDTKFFISTTDEVIDFEPFKEELSNFNTSYVPNSNHGFNGECFNEVIDYVNSV